MKQVNCICGAKGRIADEGNRFEHDYRCECTKCQFNVCLCSDPCETKKRAINTWNSVVQNFAIRKCLVCKSDKLGLMFDGGVFCRDCGYHVHEKDEETWGAMFDRFEGKRTESQ